MLGAKYLIFLLSLFGSEKMYMPCHWFKEPLRSFPRNPCCISGKYNHRSITFFSRESYTVSRRDINTQHLHSFFRGSYAVSQRDIITQLLHSFSQEAMLCLWGTLLQRPFILFQRKLYYVSGGYYRALLFIFRGSYALCLVSVMTEHLHLVWDEALHHIAFTWLLVKEVSRVICFTSGAHSYILKT